MDVNELGTVVSQTMESIRESLVVIEEAAQKEDRPALHSLARLYAMALVPMRDYLAGLQRGRPLPRTLASRLRETIEALAPLSEGAAELGLHPDMDEFRGLAALAGDVTR